MNTENCPAEPILLHLTLLLATLFGAPVTAAPSSTSPEGQSASRLVLDQPGFAARNGGQFHFRLQGETNRAYVIQASTNLVDWMPVAAYQIHPAVNFIKLLDAEAGSSQRRFYRAVAPSPTATANGSTVLALDPLEFYPLNTLPAVPGESPVPSGAAFNPGRLLVKPRPGVALGLLAPHQIALGCSVARVFPALGNLQVFQLPAGGDVWAAVQQFQASGLVEYAEPDFVVRALAEPNDPRFQDGTLWNLRNSGQSGGVSGADVRAAEAWNTRTTAETVIVAVVDTGVRYTHEDLAENLWKNPGEIPGNGVDDDRNGYIDDVHGINAIKKDGDPMDDHGHGSHVAGIIGAVGNNQLGVVGVAWKVKLMACKFINPQGDGDISDAIACIEYARRNGAQIINGSWGGPAFNSQALRDAIASARVNGIIFVAAAGNSQNDNDAGNAVYPGSFDLDNIISVLATSRRDELAFFSNWGATTVDLGAPGLDVFSCWNSSDNAYQYFLGSSMAAAHVSGACALAKTQFSGESYGQIINRILAGAEPVPALAGRCVTGGRLNLKNVLAGNNSPPPPPPPNLPTVTVRASDEKASEAAADPGEFAFSRTGDTSGALTVQFELSGIAIDGTDYKTLATSVTIAAGAASAAIQVEPLEDQVAEGDETVHLSLKQAADYTVGAAGSATVTIADNDAPPPPATVVADFTANPTLGPAPLTVQFTDKSTGPVTKWDWDFGDGSPHGTSQNPSHVYRNAGDFTVTLTVSSSGSSSKSLGIHVASQPPSPPPPSGLPTVTVTAADTNASEAGPDAGEFIFTRTGSTESALTVRFDLSGSAIKWNDYRRAQGDMPDFITISAGASEAKLAIVPVDDSDVEGSEVVNLSILEDAAYAVGVPDSAIVMIADNDQPPPPSGERPTVTVEATDATAAEAGVDPGTFTIRLSRPAASNITVRYTMGEEARNGVDYQTLSGSVTVPAGASSATVTVIPIDDSTLESNEPLILMLFGYTGAPYIVGRPDGAVVTIADNDAPPVRPTVTVVASDPQASEAGETGTFTIRLSSPAPSSFSVRYAMGEQAKNGVDYQSLSGSVTVQAGASSATVTLIPINDSVRESSEPAMLMLIGYTGAPYIVGQPTGATVTILDDD